MNFDALEKKLIAAARASQPGSQVPPAFQKRVMALIGARPVFDLGAMWARALWRAAAPCIALTIVLSAWLWLHPQSQNPPSTDFSLQFNNTMLAAVDQDSDGSW